MNLSSHEHEKIDPYFSAPWSHTLSMFPSRFSVNRCPKGTEPVNAREEHIKLVTDYQKNLNMLYIYTDGSKINRSGFLRIRAAAAAYHEGIEISTRKLGLGGHAEVFDAEMAALSLAASMASDIINDHPYITHHQQNWGISHSMS
jgi:hypothetical protein